VYKKDYPDYGGVSNPFETPVIKKTVVEDIPFIGNSQYRRNYQQRQGAIAESCKDQALLARCPLFKIFPTIKKSTYGSAYTPQQQDTTIDCKTHEDASNTPAYPGQYASIMKRSYNPKQNQHCVARTILDRLAPVAIPDEDTVDQQGYRHHTEGCS
jgi:hypothetical protein